MFDWKNHPNDCEQCNYSDADALTRERCVAYVLHLGYYSREQIEALWPSEQEEAEMRAYNDPEPRRDRVAEEFFTRYAQLKSSDETTRRCACGGSTDFVHPWFGVTGGFGPAGACRCD